MPSVVTKHSGANAKGTLLNLRAEIHERFTHGEITHTTHNCELSRSTHVTAVIMYDEISHSGMELSRTINGAR